MRDKKVIAAGILSVLAAASLIYGIVAPSKSRTKSAGAAGPQQSKKKQLTEEDILIKRHKKRTKFFSWGRNPFVIPKPIDEKFILKGILWDEESPKAIINSSILGVGGQIGKNTVVDIKKSSVILNDGRDNHEFLLE